MKTKNLVMSVLLLISILGILFSIVLFAKASTGQETHGLSTTTGSGSARAGVVIYVTSNFTLRNITTISGTSVNLSSVYNGSGSLLAVSPVQNNTANFTLNLVAGQNYSIEANDTIGTIAISACNSNQLTRPVNGSVLNWINGTFNGVVGANGGVFCNIESITYTNTNYGSNTSIYNSSTAETARESFTSNFSLDSAPSSVLFIYNKTSYSATSTSLGGNNYRFDHVLDIPLAGGIINWFWNITFSNGTTVSTNPLIQSKSAINFSVCQATPQNIPFLNFTFKNETSAQEQVNASIPTSSFTYYDNSGSGSLNKSFVYSNASELKFYSFCYTPASRALKAHISLSYDNSESEQRTYSPDALSLTNTTTHSTLFLLPSTQGQYVTFQVINVAQQPLSGVEIVASRSGIGTIETATTDSSGSVTFFLNPSFPYAFTFNKEGFDEFTTTLTPTQTSYTITLGGATGAETNVTNPQKGMSYSINPSFKTLGNDTTYNFNLTLNSSFWELSSWGFTLQNKSGFVLASNTSTSSSGGFLSRNLNTVKNSTIVMNYFWVINGDYNNATVTWTVIDLSDNGFSIFQFFTDVASFVNVGFFGLDEFGLAILTFFTIFLISGVMSWKFGINSPASIMGFIFGLVLFFDVGLDLLPNPVDAVPHAPSFIVGLIFIGMIFRELQR